MKITLTEHDGCFNLDFEAENLADAALLVRFGMNRTKEVQNGHTVANANGTITGYVNFGKNKRNNNYVPRQR